MAEFPLNLLLESELNILVNYVVADVLLRVHVLHVTLSPPSLPYYNLEEKIEQRATQFVGTWLG